MSQKTEQPGIINNTMTAFGAILSGEEGKTVTTKEARNVMVLTAAASAVAGGVIGRKRTLAGKAPIAKFLF